jgi:PTH1 family peptidyl-tRNA hydrolase
MRSVIQHLGTEEFPRLRLGVGRPPGQMPGQAYLLQDFRPDEWEAMLATYERAAKAIEVLVSQGLNTAMNQFNASP